VQGQRVLVPVGLVLAALALGAAALWRLGGELVAPQRAQLPAAIDGLPSEPVAFASASGAELRGWFVPGEPGRGALLLMHGVRSNRAQMIPRARFLHGAGYAVLAFDFQAHGESTGQQITFGQLESLDAAAALAWLTARLPGEPIGAIGVSLGGAAAVLATPPLELRALVLEAVYTDVEAAAANRIALRLGPAGRWLAPLVLLQLRPRLGVDPETLSPLARIGELRCPLLLIAGVEDRHTTLAQSRALYAAAPGPKEIWEIPGAAHVDFERFAPAEYQARVARFLAANLR
jgi:uncharacterized protein